MVRKLPTLNQLAIRLERIAVQRFCQIISAHFCGRASNDGELVAIVMRPKPMPFGQIVTGARGETVVRCEKKGAVVVLKHTTAHLRINIVRQIQDGNYVVQHSLDNNQLMESLAESTVFALLSAQNNLGHQLRLPEKRTAAQENNVAHARMGAIWIACWLGSV